MAIIGGLNFPSFGQNGWGRTKVDSNPTVDQGGLDKTNNTTGLQKEEPGTVVAEKLNNDYKFKGLA